MTESIGFLGFMIFIGEKSDDPHLAALPLRRLPVEPVQSFLGKRRIRIEQSPQCAPLLVASPHRFAFIEAAREFLSLVIDPASK